MKNAIVGTGYVGLSNAILSAQNYEVFVSNIMSEKVEMINYSKSLIVDVDVEEYPKSKNLDLTTMLSREEIYIDSSFVVVTTPTNYDP